MTYSVRFLADENLNSAIVRGLRRRLADVDIVDVREVQLAATPDPVILAWAAKHDRVLLTHDVATLTRFAYERVSAGLKMPGVIEIVAIAPVGQVIEDLALIAECGVEAEFEGQVLFIPFK